MGSVSTRAFDMSASVFENVQKNLADNTHPIGITSGANGTKYANAPTCDGVMVLRWYTSMTYRLDTRTVPCAQFASKNTCSMWDKALPNYSNNGAASRLVVLLTMGMPTSVFANRLRIRRG